MKYFLLISFLFLGITVNAQSESNNYQVTLNRIGPFKIEMKKEDVEKILKTKIKTPNNSNAIEYNYDTILVDYQNVNYTLVFFKNYISETKYEIALFSIKSKSPLLKTKSGIRVGDDKMKIIETYKDYDFYYSFIYEDDGQGNFKRSKTRSVIQLKGENENYSLFFYLNEGKVEGFEASFFEGC